MRPVVSFGGRELDWARLSPPPADVVWLGQPHRADVLVLHDDSADAEATGTVTAATADACVTTEVGRRLLIRTADCLPVAFVGRDHAGAVIGVGAAHAGWRGLVDGVLQRTVEALRGLGAASVEAMLGPCICPGCYEFGADDLARVEAVLGANAVGATRTGTAALDLLGGSQAALAGVGVGPEFIDASAWTCTACNPEEYFSWRARRDTGRQGLVAELVED